jgi:predicted SPOUT superfamily RNA methylase MTH1
MFNVLNMGLSVFIPDSVVSEDKTLRDKTLKLGYIARACSIFKVEKIYIYTDENGAFEKDFRLIKLILGYIETPQYLRRSLFPKTELLKEAGILPPLRTPPHKPYIPMASLKVGEVREGVILRKGGSLFVDIGLDSPIRYVGSGSDGERVTIVLQQVQPSQICKRALSDDIKEYWGYKVVRVGPIGKVLKGGFTGLKLITSRRGDPINGVFRELIEDMRKAINISLVFGSPKKGLYDILREENLTPKEVGDYVINFIPNQGTATVRSEEAIISSLSIISIMLKV